MQLGGGDMQWSDAIALGVGTFMILAALAALMWGICRRRILVVIIAVGFLGSFAMSALRLLSVQRRLERMHNHQQDRKGPENGTCK